TIHPLSGWESRTTPAAPGQPAALTPSGRHCMILPSHTPDTVHNVIGRCARRTRRVNIEEESPVVATREAFTSPSHKTLRDWVFECLRTSIVSGDLSPGQRIVEADLAKQLEVSKSPVREAI